MAWAEAVTAISTAIIALVVLGGGIAALRLLGEIKDLMRTVERAVDTLDRDARPALLSAKAMVDDAAKVVSAFRSEAGAISVSAKDVRERLERLVERTEERLQDLDALIEVVHYEVEETALDIAAALRTTRRGGTVLRAMKRAFLGKRR